ncbi:MAG TPA: 3-hydroxyisobutyrate dehydrogenase [Pseudonocardia sp.]|jgi:3-hydroxyisobutyrate dehydrogenase
MTESTQSSAVAVIGLGNMGGPMAANLVKAGHTVVGFDLSEAARGVAVEAGVSIAGSAADAVREADAVITMLPAGKHVLACYNGEDGVEGIIGAAKPGTLFIDSSTIDVSSSREAHEIARKAGHLSVDAPVSGGTVGASAGTLTFMAGGSDEALTRAEPLLTAMGKRTVHCGDAGAGQTAKMCNNLILAISMIGVSEAFVLAEKLGLDPQALFDVSSTATGQCWALTTNCPVPGPVPTSPANRDFSGGFASALMLKDLGLAMTAADETGAPTELGRAAAKMYEEYVGKHGGTLDFSSIITGIRDQVEGA